MQTETFKIGQYVVYQGKGLAKIANIETKKSPLGQVSNFYALELRGSKEVLMIRADKTNFLRKCATQNECENVLLIAAERIDISPNLSWAQIGAELSEKIKSGDIVKLAEIVRDLKSVQKKRSLEMHEVKVLEHAIGTLKSEMLAVFNYSQYKVLKVDLILRVFG